MTKTLVIQHCNKGIWALYDDFPSKEELFYKMLEQENQQFDTDKAIILTSWLNITNAEFRNFVNSNPDFMVWLEVQLLE